MDEDEQEEAAEGEAVHGVAHADFMIEGSGDDEVEEDGIGEAAAQAYGDLCLAEALCLHPAVVNEEGGIGEVNKAEGEGGQHGGFRSGGFGGILQGLRQCRRCCYRLPAHRRLRPQRLAAIRSIPRSGLPPCILFFPFPSCPCAKPPPAPPSHTFYGAACSFTVAGFCCGFCRRMWMRAWLPARSVVSMS